MGTAHVAEELRRRARCGGDRHRRGQLVSLQRWRRRFRRGGRAVLCGIVHLAPLTTHLPCRTRWTHGSRSHLERES
ncbi:MAG: hypothetical protein R2838_04015 [Caldilineaceae bacterium]